MKKYLIICENQESADKVNEFIAVCSVIGVNPFDYPLPHAQGEANA